MTSTDTIILAVVILIVIAVIAYPFAKHRLERKAAVAAGTDAEPYTVSACTNRDVAVLSADDAASAPRCRPVGAWDVYPGAWTEAPGFERPGSPRTGLTTARCAALCAADPDCATWVNNPGAYCRHYSIVPGVVTGSSANTVGFRRNA